eukprot:UN13642
MIFSQNITSKTSRFFELIIDNKSKEKNKVCISLLWVSNYFPTP